MKLLTITIPCYNSAEYMEHAVNSALVCENDVEILIIDDGSTDDTFKIARKLEDQHKDCIRVIHKENGGHGSAVNTGIQNASGVYFKVLDSDDWLDEDSLKQVIKLLKKMISEGTVLDMLVCNYVYEKPSKNKQKVVNYLGALPRNKVITWRDANHFRMAQNLLMHSLIYRTKLLVDCGLKLPEHTFYVDNIYAYYPLPYVKTFYYLDVDLYRYFIGRNDQSVNEKVMIKRIDQQIRVTKIMIDCCDPLSIHVKGLRKYMIKYLAMIMIVTSALLVKDGSPESLRKRDQLWKYLKNKNLRLYKTISRLYYGYPLQSNSKGGKKVIVNGYRILNHIYGFN